ncbi:MAG: glucose 1-dehydrogenase [Balneolaceae bacterium]
MNKTAIITGAANGIGKAIAMAYTTKGYHSFIADIDSENGKKVEEKCLEKGGQATFIKTDVSDPKLLKDLVARVMEASGRIDVLINNAGVSEFCPPEELSVERWDQILNTNLRSSFLLTRLAAKKMKITGGGSVVNIASTRALMSEKHSEAYAASKGGLLALTHAMALSYADDKIRVNCISPGWIHTGDYDSLRDIDHQQHPSGRVGKPDDIARACLFLTDSANDFINGENLIIDGGMTRKMIYEH